MTQQSSTVVVAPQQAPAPVKKRDVLWKDVVGFEGLYQVSNTGRIKSLSRTRWNGKVNAKVSEKELFPTKRRDGYLIATLSNNKDVIKEYVHRIVALAFIQTDDNTLTVNHKDGNHSNNNVDNLEWCSYSENHIHAYRVLKS
jgi:hypothetical protein